MGRGRERRRKGEEEDWEKRRGNREEKGTAIKEVKVQSLAGPALMKHVKLSSNYVYPYVRISISSTTCLVSMNHVSSFSNKNRGLQAHRQALSTHHHRWHWSHFFDAWQAAGCCNGKRWSNPRIIPALSTSHTLDLTGGSWTHWRSRRQLGGFYLSKWCSGLSSWVRV